MLRMIFLALLQDVFFLGIRLLLIGLLGGHHRNLHALFHASKNHQPDGTQRQDESHQAVSRDTRLRNGGRGGCRHPAAVEPARSCWWSKRRSSRGIRGRRSKARPATPQSLALSREAVRRRRRINSAFYISYPDLERIPASLQAGAVAGSSTHGIEGILG